MAKHRFWFCTWFDVNPFTPELFGKWWKLTLHNRRHQFLSRSVGLSHATATPFGTDNVGWLCFLTHTITHGCEQGQCQWKVDSPAQNTKNGKNEGGPGPLGVKYINFQWFNFMQTVLAVRLGISLQEMPRPRTNCPKSVANPRHLIPHL